MELRISTPPLYKWEIIPTASPEEIERRMRALAWDQITYVMLRAGEQHWLEASGSREDAYSLRYREGQVEFITKREVRKLDAVVAALRAYAAGDGRWKAMFAWTPFEDEKSDEESARYESLVFKAVKGCTESEPVKLEDILNWVDSQDRLVLDRESLEDSLRCLIAAGRVAETGRLHFYDPQRLPAPRTFEGISEAEYERAVEDYHALFQRMLKESKKRDSGETFSRHILTVRWAFPGRRYPQDDDQERMEELAEKLDAILAEGGQAEINGFEFGPGTLDMLIFGKETDAHTDQVYSAIVSAFRLFPNPPGACLIRYYEERGEELVSDVVKA